MPKVNMVDVNSKSVGEVNLADDVFAVEVNEALLYEVVKAQLGTRRSGSAKSKGRAEVRGSSRKIFKQKGTGRARHGSIRAPIFVGGGTVHGPTPRSYGFRPPRKMRAGALRSALSLKLKEGRLVVLDRFDMDEPKTKAVVSAMDNLDAKKSAIIVDHADNIGLALSARNLPKHRFLPPEGVNVYDVLRHEHLIVTEAAVQALTERLAQPSTNRSAT